MSKKKPSNRSLFPGPVETFEKGCQALGDNVYHWLVKSDPDLRFIKITVRDNGEMVAVLAVFADDGSPIVAFGNGPSIATALWSLDKTLAGDNWKEDKFAKGIAD